MLLDLVPFSIARCKDRSGKNHRAERLIQRLLPKLNDFIFRLSFSHFDKPLANDTHPLHDRLIFNIKSRSASLANTTFRPLRCHTEKRINSLFPIFYDFMTTAVLFTKSGFQCSILLMSALGVISPDNLNVMKINRSKFMNPQLLHSIFAHMRAKFQAHVRLSVDFKSHINFTSTLKY